jgi:hypothetical protein
MIQTNKFEHRHLRIKGTSCARKTDENISKKTRKSNELQNRESTQPRKLPFTRRSDSLQTEEKI